MFTRTHTVWKLLLALSLLVLSSGLLGCEGCESKDHPALKVPFSDNFDRKELGKLWKSEMMGRWRIEYDNKTKNGRLCVEQTRNNPLFLLRRLPRDVVVELDVWAHDRIGDVKVELFTDGRYHSTGYVLVHGGWKNTLSIIDRLDEHNPNCKYKDLNKELNCRRWKRGGPKQNKKYHWKIVRSGKKLSWYIDGKLFLTYNDPDPLSGKAHAYFAFSNWVSRGCFDNLKIRKYTPAAVSSVPKVPAAAANKAAPAPRKAPVPAKLDYDDDKDDPAPTGTTVANQQQQAPQRPAPRLRIRRNNHAVLKIQRPAYAMPKIQIPQLKLKSGFNNRVYLIRPKVRTRRR